MIDPAPIRDMFISRDGRLSSIWAIWLGKLTSRVNEGEGVTGTFTTVDSKTVTVTNGIITDIS